MTEPIRRQAKRWDYVRRPPSGVDFEYMGKNTGNLATLANLALAPCRTR
ncbi:MAG: hypothetical protein R2744_09860 [Bacteroidales bacterium]